MLIYSAPLRSMVMMSDIIVVIQWSWKSISYKRDEEEKIVTVISVIHSKLTAPVKWLQE